MRHGRLIEYEARVTEQIRLAEASRAAAHAASLKRARREQPSKLRAGRPLLRLILGV